MMHNRKFVRFAGCLLAILYVAYFMGGHLFVHHHHLQNRVVVHSHPFSNPNHSHSTAQLLTIDQLNADTCLPSHQAPVVMVVAAVIALLSVPVVSAVLGPSRKCSLLRAPPAL